MQCWGDRECIAAVLGLQGMQWGAGSAALQCRGVQGMQFWGFWVGCTAVLGRSYGCRARRPAVLRVQRLQPCADGAACPAVRGAAHAVQRADDAQQPLHQIHHRDAAAHGARGGTAHAAAALHSCPPSLFPCLFPPLPSAARCANIALSAAAGAALLWLQHICGCTAAPGAVGLRVQRSSGCSIAVVSVQL